MCHLRRGRQGHLSQSNHHADPEGNLRPSWLCGLAAWEAIPQPQRKRKACQLVDQLCRAKWRYKKPVLCAWGWRQATLQIVRSSYSDGHQAQQCLILRCNCSTRKLNPARWPRSSAKNHLSLPRTDSQRYLGWPRAPAQEKPERLDNLPPSWCLSRRHWQK